jgi:adenylate kinase
VLLDGFPRTTVQAEALDPLLASLNRSLTAVIALELSDEEAIHRLGGRRMCEGLGDPFPLHIDDTESVNACLRLGGRLVTRPDDEPDVIRERLRVYDTETQPLIGYYGQKGVLHRMSAAGDPDEVHSRIVEVLEHARR